MAQADSNLTTRRGFSKWLAAVGVATAAPVSTTMPASAAGASTSIDWERVELELTFRCAQVTFLDDKIAQAEKALAQWEARNPWPDEPLYDSHNARIDDFANMNKALGDHAVRRIAAMKQCGRGPLKERRRAKLDLYHAECQRIAALPAVTLGDVRAKTRLATMYEHAAGGPIHQAILRDLQTIGA